MIDMDLLDILYKDNKQDLLQILDKLPHPVKPVVTQSDAVAGFITRYFVKLVNDDYYIVEIDLKQYERLKKNFRFATTKLQWKIVGKKETLMLQTGVNIYGVADTNRLEVINADLTFKGIRNYISDYLELWVTEDEIIP